MEQLSDTKTHCSGTYHTTLDWIVNRLDLLVERYVYLNYTRIKFCTIILPYAWCKKIFNFICLEAMKDFRDPLINQLALCM